MESAERREKQLKGKSRAKKGKSVEFGRKWIVNCYRGGYMLVMAPENPKISDQHCVLESNRASAT